MFRHVLYYKLGMMCCEEMLLDSCDDMFINSGILWCFIFVVVGVFSAPMCSADHFFMCCNVIVRCLDVSFFVIFISCFAVYMTF